MLILEPPAKTDEFLSKQMPKIPEIKLSDLFQSKTSERVVQNIQSIGSRDFMELSICEEGFDIKLLRWITSLIDTFSGVLSQSNLPIEVLNLINRPEWWICLRFWGSLVSERLFHVCTLHFRNSNSNHMNDDKLYPLISSPEVPEFLSSFLISLFNYYSICVKFVSLSKTNSVDIFLANLLSNLDCLLLPPSSFVFSLVELSSSFEFLDDEISKTGRLTNFFSLVISALNFFQIYLKMNSPRISNSDAVASYIRLHFLAFVRAYRAPEFTKSIELLCIAHCSCLLTISTSCMKLPVAAATFFQLRVVPFLSREFDLEYQVTIPNKTYLINNTVDEMDRDTIESDSVRITGSRFPLISTVRMNIPRLIWFYNSYECFDAV